MYMHVYNIWEVKGFYQNYIHVHIYIYKKTFIT